MDKVVIRKITAGEVESAMALALEVFMQFEAPDNCLLFLFFLIFLKLIIKCFIHRSS